MAKSKESTKKGKTVVKRERSPLCQVISDKGIVSGNDFAAFMSALMGDLVSGRVNPRIGNAACNAGGRLLKVVELQMRHGTKAQANGLLLLKES